MTPETMIPLNLYLNYISRAYEDFIKRKLNNPDIDPAELPFLIGIYHNEGASQNEISASFRVTEAYVTKMLNKLEKKDLIKREYDPNNKTRKLIYLTNKGLFLLVECTKTSFLFCGQITPHVTFYAPFHHLMDI